MEEQAVMRTLRAAHKAGLAMMDRLSSAVVDLQEGRGGAALNVFGRVLQFCERDLQLHFDHEERALFPVMRRIIGPGGPVEAMVSEHETLWRCIEELAGEVEVARDASLGAREVATLQRLANHAAWLLCGHIEREDTMLFPLAERILDERGWREVSLNFQMLQEQATRERP